MEQAQASVASTVVLVAAQLVVVSSLVGSAAEVPRIVGTVMAAVVTEMEIAVMTGMVKGILVGRVQARIAAQAAQLAWTLVVGSSLV